MNNKSNLQRTDTQLFHNAKTSLSNMLWNISGHDVSDFLGKSATFRVVISLLCIFSILSSGQVHLNDTFIHIHHGRGLNFEWTTLHQLEPTLLDTRTSADWMVSKFAEFNLSVPTLTLILDWTWHNEIQFKGVTLTKSTFLFHSLDYMDVTCQTFPSG